MDRPQGAGNGAFVVGPSDPGNPPSVSRFQICGSPNEFHVSVHGRNLWCQCGPRVGLEVELPTTTRCCGCGLVPGANPVRPGMVRAKFARRVSPCFVGTADQVRPRVTKATSAHRVPTWFVRTPTRCLPGWQGPCLSECAAGQRGPCMLVRHEVPSHTPSSGGHGSATRAHGTRILEPHGLVAHPSQQQRCRPCRTCNETSNLCARLPALTTLPAASLETVSENMLRIEGKCQ